MDSAGLVVVMSLVAGLLLEIGIRGGPANVIVAAGLAVALVLLWLQPRFSGNGRVLVVAAAIPTLFLGVRASEWLTSLNLLAIVGLVTLAVIFSANGSPFDTAVWHVVTRVFTSLGRGLMRLLPLTRSLPGPQSTTAQTAARSAKAVLIALPLLAVLIALLAASDVVFAGLIAPDLRIGPLVGHVLLALILAAPVVVGVLSAGSAPNTTNRHGKSGVLETNIVLGLAALVLGLFVLSQAVALTGAGQRLIGEAGLTPAEYARTGFFQLCWASVVVVGYLALARFLASADTYATTSVRVLSAAVPLLALGLVGVSLRRMALYDEAFGLTMLRLSVIGACVWIGAVLVMMAARNAGMAMDREWVFGGAVSAALVVVIAANVMNPEAFVVRHNVARAAAGATVDADYFALLSADAIPAIAEAATQADSSRANELRDVIGCDDRARGVATLNLAVGRAAAVRRELCIS